MRVHGVDAAVMFADIMLPILGMGIDVELVEGVGPVVAEPVRTMADVERLRVPDPEEAVPFILEAVRLVRGALAPEQALVGFCGGPFTVAGYLVEGKPTREFSVTKRCMYGSPEVWHALCEKLAATSEAYLRATVEAGADAVQLFDSWVGALSRDDYEEFVAPYSKRILEAVDVPTIHFGTGTSHLLETMAETGGDVIGLDWRVRLDEGWERVGHDRGVQGNLDPALLLGPFERVESAAIAILDAAGGRPGHIFNLGHGVLPDTDPADLKRLVELVHERTAPHEARGRADGLREPVRPRGHPSVPRGHPLGPAGLGRGGRGADRALPADRRTLAARRRDRGDARGLERELGFPVYAGMKHWTPRIAEAVDLAIEDGADQIVGLVLAPHYSQLSIDGYRERLEDALDGRAGAAVRRELARARAVPGRARRSRARHRRHVVFTAHSLPARILDMGDPYRDQLLETSQLVAERAGLDAWSFAFQSASATGEPWLGPDILEELDNLARARRRARARLPDRLRLRPPGDPVGHRRRGP